VDRLYCFDHFHRFELDMLAVQVLKQSNAAAKQHRDEVDRDIFITCRFLCFFKRSLNAIGETIYTSMGYVLGNTV